MCMDKGRVSFVFLLTCYKYIILYFIVFISVGNETNQLQKAGDEPKDSKQINHLQEMVKL